VVGESQDKAHPNTIEVLSFSLGIENQATVGSATGGAGAGKADFTTLEIVKLIDAASPVLFSVAAAGAHFNQANLYVRKAGDQTNDYLVYRLRMVFPTRVDWSGSAGDASPTETVKFAYGALQVQYTQQAPAGAAQGKVNTTSWSQVTNKPEFVVPGT
jgi:type VI secretion system secreted protein Hcp